MDERLIRLFEEELRHLRETAAEFGRAFPDRAKYLDPKSRPFEGMVADPYVERLLEGVAFMAARVRLKLDSQFPQFTQGLLETLYPDFLAPVPSMAIFQLTPDPAALPPPQGLVVARQTRIEGLPGQEFRVSGREPTPCIFSLAHDIRLLPVELVQADCLVRNLHEAKLPVDWKARGAIRLRFRKKVTAPWAEIALDPLVIHVPKSDGLGYEILENLFAHQIGMVVGDGRRADQPNALESSDHPVHKFGFEPACALIPSNPRTFEGHRLLREYFALPERFAFFELRGFQSCLTKCRGDELEIVIALDDASKRLEQQLKASCLRLFCAPAINLFRRQFSQVIEPDRFTEFQLVPDANRPVDFEVYSVDSVEAFSNSSPSGRAFRPFFETHPLHAVGKAFFTVSRQPRSRADTGGPGAEGDGTSYAGSEVFVSLVDSQQAPFDGDIDQLLIGAQLSNRHLPLLLVENPSKWLLSGGIKARVTPLAGPTAPAYRPVDGPYAWRLLNLLAVNYLVLTDDSSDAAAGLREVLGLYAGEDSDWAKQQIDALRRLTIGTVSRPLYQNNGNNTPPRILAIMRGQEIGLHFEDSAFLDMSVVILGSVLEEFFARYAAINSFTETVLKTPDGRDRIRWPARKGLKPTA